MNQFFVFRKLGMLPKIFSDLKFDFKSVDKTIIEYANENYGKNVIFNLPFNMVDCGEFIREVYPHSIVMGLLDDISKFNEDILKHLGSYDYIILYSENLVDVISFRSYLKKFMYIRPGFKRIVILKVSEETSRDDLELFLDMSRIYNYRPVLLIENNKILDHIQYLVDLRKASHCTTKWFNYNVLIYFLRNPIGPLTILMPYKNQMLK
ncbi:MAG: hypothetical protein J7J82_06500 [Staphylothermus sp.]|nr:hypothetical protein [Staphylothermus sp.]